MKCPKCGSEQTRSDALFCQECGVPLPHASVQQPLSVSKTKPLPGDQTLPVKPGNPGTQRTRGPADTAPLPDLPTAFAQLPVGAIVQQRYAVLEVRAQSDQMNLYLVEDLAPVRQCSHCGTQSSDTAERFCASCGADLAQSPLFHVRYRMKEGTDPQTFALEAQLLGLRLGHPGLFLPVAIFSEAPYGPERQYRVAHEFAPQVAAQLPAPQELPQVLEWSSMLAQALAHLHQHQVSLQAVTLNQVGIEGKRAVWVNLERAFIIPPESRTQAQEFFAKDVQGLAQILLYLATGQSRPKGRPDLPDAVVQLLAQVLNGGAGLTAATFAGRLEMLLQEIRRPESVSLVVGRRTDVGQVRSLNEDSLLTLDIAPVYRSLNQPVGVFVVADGMGGHDAGDVASQLTCSTIGELATLEVLGPASAGKPLPDPVTWLKQAVRHTNQVVYEQRRAAGSDMGTTLVMAYFVGAQATIANVGDSRGYLLHAEGITQLTVDHSLVERLVATGQITKEEAAHHPQRNVIYRVMGDKPKLEVDIYEQRLQLGEALLFCSDGLSGMVSDQQILQTWRTSTSPQEACDRLVEAANHAGGEDNITVVIIQVVR